MRSSFSRRLENGASSLRQQKSGPSRKFLREFMTLHSKVSPCSGCIFILLLNPSSLVLPALELESFVLGELAVVMVVWIGCGKLGYRSEGITLFHFNVVC